MKEFKGFRADRLRKAMKENGATIKDIKKEMEKNFNISHILDSHIENVVAGKDIPLNGDIFVICKVVNVSADYLLGLSDEMY